MKKKLLIPFCLCIFLMHSSCRKEAVGDKITLEGIVVDDASKKPLPGIFISIDAIKAPTEFEGWDGKRVTVGTVTTDANGYYHVGLNVFKGAEHVDFYINPGQKDPNYTDSRADIYLSDLKMNSTNKIDFALSPIGTLKIHFKNSAPVSDSDFFYFDWYPFTGMLIRENCGTVIPSVAFTWTGKDVCGTNTVGTIAEKYTYIWWHVKKGGVLKNYGDSIFIKRGIVNEFYLNY